MQSRLAKNRLINQSHTPVRLLLAVFQKKGKGNDNNKSNLTNKEEISNALHIGACRFSCIPDPEIGTWDTSYFDGG